LVSRNWIHFCLLSTGYNFLLAFSSRIGFSLKGRPQKERLENFFSSLKMCVYLLKETYFFFAVFFAAFFAGAFFTGIVYSPPPFTFTAMRIIFCLYYSYMIDFILSIEKSLFRTIDAFL
jgi:hypothetical protein